VLPFSTTSDYIVPNLEQAGYTVTFYPYDGDHSVLPVVAEAALSWLAGS
jgi:predicted esterase